MKLIPLPVITASCVAMAIRNHWLFEYGIPKTILTDRGSNFTGLILRILTKLYGIKHLFTTAYHPRTNGRLERFHRYLKQRLRILAYDRNLDFLSSDDWDIYVPNIAYSYNITPNRMTHYSPYHLIYGTVIKLPIDRILQTDLKGIVEYEKAIARNPVDARMLPMEFNTEHRDYIRLIGEYQKHLQKEVKYNMDKYNKSQKQQYDKKRVPATKYVNKQVVWVDWSQGQVGNLAKLPINRRRAVIIDKIGDNVYVVRYANGKVAPVNVERIYTITEKDDNNSKPTDNKPNDTIKIISSTRKRQRRRQQRTAKKQRLH